MKINNRYCFILLILLVVLMTIGFVSATDMDNNTVIEKNDNTITDNSLVKDIDENILKQNKQATNSPETTYVNSKANENNTGKTINKPTTLTKAIETSKNNQIIYLTTTANNDTYKFTKDIPLSSRTYDIQNITIIGEENKRIIFDGQNSSGIFEVYDMTLTLKNIVITNVNFYNGIIYASNSNVIFDNCTIINNKPNVNTELIIGHSSKILINNSIIEDNHLKGSNALIYSSNGDIIIDSSVIKNNKVEDYGIINSRYNNNSIFNSKFINNTSLKKSSVLYAMNSTNIIKETEFINNYGNKSGTLFLQESLTNIRDSQFINNTANDIGGAITQLGNTSLIINKTNFTNNYAKYQGGSIYSIQSNVLIQSSIFTNNQARNGGALYLVNNVNKISIKVTDNIFKNNRAEIDGDSIWTNYDNNITNNVFTSTNNNNWIRLEKNYKNNINENWWSSNTPNFDVITNGIVPDNWRLMTVSSKITDNVNKITVSLKTLSNSQSAKNKLPERIVQFTASSGKFNKVVVPITTSISNNYVGESENIQVRIDNQLFNLNNKLEPYLSINNVTANVGEKIQFIIESNKNINSDVVLSFNNVTLKNKLTNGKVVLNYTIPDNWKTSNITTTLKLAKTGKYDSKTIKGYLYVKQSNNIVIKATNSTDLRILSSKLPKAYDLRNESLVTNVKLQGGSGSCWAFTSIASLESVLLKNTGVSYDLSENNMKNLLKKYSPIGSNTGEPNGGNNDFEPISFLVGWYGPVNEVDDYYDSNSVVSPLIDSNIHIQDVYIIPERTSQTDNELIKQAIYNYGAVSTGIYLSGKNSYTTDHNINHGVTIVGWDDNYSKTNFSPNAPGNGAFIVKNSWGTSSGDGGYHYVSYYDKTIGSLCNVNDSSNEQFNYVVLFENQDNYDNIYQYDTIVNALSTESNLVAYKNIYTASKDENIAAFGSYFLQESDYEVIIQVNGKDNYSQKGHVSLTGYRTIKLNNYVTVNQGDEFTIILKVNRTNNGHQYIIVQYSDIYHSPIKKGQSFLEMDVDDGDWLDLYDYECVGPLKVYTKDTAKVYSTAIKNNNEITVVTTVENCQSKGTLYYYVNDKLVKNGSVTLKKTIQNDSTVITTFAYNSKHQVNLTVKYYSENYQIHQNITLNSSDRNSTLLTVNLNKKSLKVNDNIVISGQLYSNKPLNNQNVVIRINDEEYSVKTDSNGKYKLTFKTTMEGINNIIVYYKGSSSYSEALNATTFKANKKNTHISINKINVGEYLKKVVISGNLTSDNVGIKGKTVIINIDGVEYTTLTSNNGYFSINYKIDSYSDKQVVFKYLENVIYKSSTNSTQLFVKKPTNIVYDKIGSVYTPSNITISGTLFSQGHQLSNQKVLIYINDKKYTIKTNDFGKFELNYKINDSKDKSITFTFQENDNYYGSTNNMTLIPRKITMISSYDRESVVFGSVVKVGGKLLDANGKGIKGQSVTVKIGSEVYVVKTSSTGLFYVSYEVSSYAKHNVIFYYDKNSVYLGCKNSTYFYVRDK